VLQKNVEPRKELCNAKLFNYYQLSLQTQVLKLLAHQNYNLENTDAPFSPVTQNLKGTLAYFVLITKPAQIFTFLFLKHNQ
jgi:hypothetical protein